MTLHLNLDHNPAPLTLTCDSDGCDAFEVFALGDYLANRAAATRKGWRESQTSAGRLFICGRCKPPMRCIVDEPE